MNTRIRYTRHPEGYLISKQVLKSNTGEEYIVTISSTGFTGKVYKADDMSCVSVVDCVSQHKTKIAIKKELAKLGVVFGKETRKDRNEIRSNSIGDGS